MMARSQVMTCPTFAVTPRRRAEGIATRVVETAAKER